MFEVKKKQMCTQLQLLLSSHLGRTLQAAQSLGPLCDFLHPRTFVDDQKLAHIPQMRAGMCVDVAVFRSSPYCSHLKRDVLKIEDLN